MVGDSGAAVVRLGASNVQVVNSQRYRVLQGQALGLQYATDNSTVTVRAWARVRYDNGEDGILFIPDQALTGDPPTVRLARSSDVTRMDGWVTDALVEVLDEDVKRGQVYVRLFMDPFGPLLCKDYVYSDFGQVALGTYIESGPGGGSGNLRIVTLAAEGVPATFTVSLAVSNIIRCVRSFALYYEASVDVATRVCDSQLYGPLGALPTGFTSGADIVWEATVLTLTSDQAGCEFADEQRAGINDNGTITVDDQSTDPTPFPLWIAEGDQSVLRFGAQTPHANDRWTVYALYEDWVVLQN